jgi:hypothetical protein
MCRRALLRFFVAALAFTLALGSASAYVARGPRGGTVARGPRGGTIARGPRGGTVARGPHGGRYGRSAYYRGRYWRAPGWGAARYHRYGRGFVGYPGWRYYGTVGLAAGLAGFATLGFLSSGMLVGTYPQEDQTVYVYVVNDGENDIEYQVDSNGNIISQRVLPPEE